MGTFLGISSSRWVMILWLAFNLIVLLLYGYDKLASKTGNVKLRISEKALLIAAAFGGVGALGGMYLFRHKTQHKNFRILIPIFAVAQAVLVLFLYIKLFPSA